MKALYALIVAALFLALPLATAGYYSPHYHSQYHFYYSPHYGYGGADFVFRGEVTRIQRLGGSNPRVEVTFRVRERIRGNPSTTVVVTLPRYRDRHGYFYDNNPFIQGREYVVATRRSDSRNRLLWYEPASHYRPPHYVPPVYQPPHHTIPRPPSGVTIPNPHTTNTCTVVDVGGQVVVVCPSTQTPPRLEPLAIGDPQPTVRIIDNRPGVPIAAFPGLH